jgi:PAS domain S-box-containing protein
MQIKRRETVDLWITIIILLVMVVYHLGANVIGGFDKVLHKDIASLLSNGLFIWLVGMLWIAYQRYKNISEKETVLDDIISSTGLEVVMTMDDQRVITMSNEAVTLVFGYQVDEVVGREAAMLFGDDWGNEEHEHHYREAVQSLGFYRDEWHGMKKNGDSIILEVAVVPRKKAEGRVLLVQDITTRKQHEQELKLAKEKAEAATREKEDALDKLDASYQRLRELEIHRDNLIHMVCHDMKAPLQVLILQLDILKEMVIEKLDNDELESVDTLLAYSRQLEIMVHSMLDLSKLESGKLPMRLKTGNINQAIDESIQFMEFMKGDNTIVFDRLDWLPNMDFDHDTMQRILVNLLMNAVKYSPSGADITVGIEEIGQFLRISITDRGPGIPEEFRTKIFEKFGQVTKKGHERRGSTGLGLTFCKMAIEAHGGSIGVDSEEGRGSSFWLTLPLHASLIPKGKRGEREARTEQIPEPDPTRNSVRSVA